MNAPISALLDRKGSLVHAIEATLSAFDAVAEMNRLRIGAIVIFDGEKIAGIFTERDVLRRIVGEVDTVYPVKQLLAVIADDSVSDSEIDAFLASYVPPAVDEEGEAEKDAYEYIDLPIGTVRYAKYGDGGKTLLFIHGFGGDLEINDRPGQEAPEQEQQRGQREYAEQENLQPAQEVAARLFAIGFGPGRAFGDRLLRRDADKIGPSDRLEAPEDEETGLRVPMRAIDAVGRGITLHRRRTELADEVTDVLGDV